MLKQSIRPLGLALLCASSVLMTGCIMDESTQAYDPYTPTASSNTVYNYKKPSNTVTNNVTTTRIVESASPVESNTAHTPITKTQAPVATSVTSSDPAMPPVLVTQPGTSTPVPPPIEEPVMQ